MPGRGHGTEASRPRLCRHVVISSPAEPTEGPLPDPSTHIPAVMSSEVQISALPLTDHGTLGRWRPCLMPQFPYL